MSSSFRHVIGGSLMVAGTSVGAGMLALPVVTGAAGFYPSLLIYALCWLFMSATGLLMLEICLRLAPGANLITMSETYLGKIGKSAAWILYLFLFYCLSIAYVSGGGNLLSGWLGLNPIFGQIAFVLFLAPWIYFGAKRVDRVNLFLMAGLIASYCLFVGFGLPRIESALLQTAVWKPALLALPVIFTSFSYQGIIPSLTQYLRRDAGKLRIAILTGTTLTFVIYILWEILILGIIPAESLEAARLAGQTAVQPLRDSLGQKRLVSIGQAFAFFAITTSYLGVNLGLFDFLADGLKLAKKGAQRIGLAALTFAPPLAIALYYPGIFISALVFAGGIGCALLLGLLPILMAWKARSRMEEGPVLLPGGKPLLLLLLCFTLLELAIELL